MPNPDNFFPLKNKNDFKQKGFILNSNILNRVVRLVLFNSYLLILVVITHHRYLQKHLYIELLKKQLSSLASVSIPNE